MYISLYIARIPRRYDSNFNVLRYPIMYIAMHTFKISFVTGSTDTITTTNLQTEEDLLILKPNKTKRKNWHKEKP